MANLQVGRRTIEMLRDKEDFTKWSDEELMRGQKADKRGRYHGQLPKVIPLALLQELNRRKASHATKRLIELLMPAVEYLGQVVEGKVQPDPDRMRACETIINRILGKQQDRVVIVETEQNKYAQAGVREAIVVRSAIDVESTEEEDEDDPFES